MALGAFAEVWDDKYLQINKSRRAHWENLNTLFSYPQDTILNLNEPAFYCVPPKLYAYYRELAEDAELNAVADERMKNPEIVKVNLDDL